MALLNFGYIFLAALLSLLISPLAIRLAVNTRLVDYPEMEPHKTHRQIMPIAGGIVISIALYTLSLVGGLFGHKDIMAILVAGIIILLFGFADDFHPLSPFRKLIGQVVGTVLLIVLGVRVSIFPWAFLNWAITLFWVVGMTNAFNFVDSMDGLAPGLAGVASAMFMLVTFESGQLYLSTFSAILVGLCAGVYFFSALPAYYFLGDSGAQFLGFVLSSLAIAYNPLGFLPTQSWFIPIMLLGVPIFDAVLVVFSRLRRKRSIYLSSLDHTYHRLAMMGIHPNRAVLIMHISAALLGCLAFITLFLPPIWANIVFASTVVAGGAVLVYLEKWI
jgi:UDP-GlcNAc:undecaprenyl-phosphate/decaprenyl-phosphate GlcNAc-1-phosphate transferase